MSCRWAEGICVDAARGNSAKVNERAISDRKYGSSEWAWGLQVVRFRAVAEA